MPAEAIAPSMRVAIDAFGGRPDLAPMPPAKRGSDNVRYYMSLIAHDILIDAYVYTLRHPDVVHMLVSDLLGCWMRMDDLMPAST
jgi:hypothetical protein